MEDAAQLLSPAEADWPPELRLPPPPSEPPPVQAIGMHDSQFLGSIMGEPPPPPPQQQAQAEAPVGVKRKRGRPPKNRDGAVVVAAKAAAKPARRREDEEEVVCFICFDGGNLVVCDRRGCPKVYHPACIKREESFFQSRSKWNCGWHICSSCEKAVHYMCYTCTYSVCKVCIKQGKFFSVRGTKGFCDTCFGTILLIESKDGSTKVQVDFDDRNSWEYLFKLYWLDLKGKLSLTLEELTSAKSRWNVPSTYARKEKDESSDDLYDANNDDDAGSDCSSGKRKRTNSSIKRSQKRRKAISDCSIAAKKVEIATGDAGNLPKKVPSEGVSLPVDTKWASPELLEFVGHMRDSDQSFISQFDVQALLLDYIKQNNLRDPRRKSQIICDSRLHRLFRKKRVAHFEMLKLLEMHFVVNEASTVNNDNQGVIDPNSARIDASGYSDMTAKLCPDRRRRMHRKMGREPNANLEDYAAVDMHNINLMYLRRSLMEDLIDDATFSVKVDGAFVRIKISGVGQKQDMYRLVKVIGTHKVSEKYSIGKKMTNFALEILNLDKKEIITMDTISNQDFTETCGAFLLSDFDKKEECKRLRQSMKCGLITRIKVGDVQEKAKIFLSVRVNDWLENEKQRLGHLRDRASETGRRKELRECVGKLQLLNTSEARTRRINEILEVHVDSHMDPDYESAEEIDDKKAVEQNVNWTRSDAFFSSIKAKYSNIVQNHAQKSTDASRHPKNLSKQSTIRKSGEGRNSEYFHSTIGSDIPKSGTNVNSTMCEAASHSSSGVTLSSDMEPEKVWHYKDPSGNVQGPFTLLQLSKWTSYFPRDLRVWLTFESEERSLLLTEVLSKQPKDFGQAASVTTSSKATLAGSGQNDNSPNVDLNNSLSPVGYSVLNSSEITVRSTKYSVPERESVNSLDDRLSLLTSSVPPKNPDTSNNQVQYQTKHSGFPPSPGSQCGQSDLHHDGVQGRRSGEWNNHHSSGDLWSPTLLQTSCSGQSNVESHHNQHATRSQVQNDSKSSLQAGSVKDLNSRPDYSQNLPTQRIGRDVPSPVFAWSPSESRTASSQHEGSCLSSTTNPSTHDELHSSIASVKAKSCAPATPVEDRGSSSPSGMLSRSERVPICSPQSAPASASQICKMEIMNQQKILEADASNASANQSPQSKIFPESFPDNHDIEREYPSPTPIFESKEPAVDYSGSTSVAPEICKMVVMNQQKTLEADASNASVNQSPQSKIFPESSPDNQDTECEYPSPTPRSESKESAVDHSGSTSVAPEICKMEIMNRQKTLEVDASNASVNQSPQSKSFPESSDDQDVEREYPSPTLRSETKEPAVDHSGSTSVAPEICKMQIMNQQKTLEVDASNASVNQYPQSKSFPESSDNQDVEREYPSPTLRSESKEPAVDHSGSTSVAPEICKMEIMNQQKTLEVDASNASVNQYPQSKSFPESSDSQDVEREYPSPTLRSESKEPAVDHPGSTSVATEICKMEIMNQQKTLEADASNASVNQSPQSKSFPESSDNQDVEREYPSPTLRSESKEPAVDHSGSTSVAPEICKMEIMNQQKTLEADASNASVNQSPQSKIFPGSSPDNNDVKREYPSPTPRSESKEPAVDHSGSTSVAPKNVAIKIPDHTPVAFVLPKSGPPSGEIDATESVSNLEKTDLKGEGSNIQNIQKELYIESTVVTRENMAIDTASCAESIDVSDVLESLIEQRCGTSYMDGTAALEDLLTASLEEEPQCSSPIALSPWGEPGYYQCDAVDSALWGVQDDSINDMWSLPSPTPALHHSSGVEIDWKGTARVINEVTVTQGNNGIVQRGPTPGEKKVELANSGASTTWGLVEQVKSKANDASVSIDGSTGLVGWQPSANGSSSVDAAWSTSQNPNLSSSYEIAAPSSRSSHEASRKHEFTYLNVASAGEALGNAKSWNASTGNANRGSQRSHHNDRYSQISESWLLSSNYSRSRSDGFGSGGSSRTVPRGQTQRGICKFHEGGYCRKGASCKYLHP